MGRAVAQRLGRSQPVVVNDRNEQRAQETLAELERQGIDAAVFVADVAERAGVRRMVEETVERWGRLDVIVNTAGGVKGPIDNPLLEITDEQWQLTLRANLTSTFLCLQEAGRVMVEQRAGSIVNVGSTSWGGSPRRAHYAAAKAGIVALTHSAATQLGPYGVRVNVVVPGATVTAVAARGVFDRVTDWSSHNPLGRPNAPEDVADAVAFLVSDESRNVSGQVLTIAGGINPSL